MSPERWQQVEAALDAVLDAEPAARASVLHRVCRGDPALRDEVEHLLEAHDAAGSYLEAPAKDFASPLFAETELATAAYPSPTPASSRDTVVYRPPSEADAAARRTAPAASPPPPTKRSTSAASAHRRATSVVLALLMVAIIAAGIVWYTSPRPPLSESELLAQEVPPLLGAQNGRSLTAGKLVANGTAVLRAPSSSTAERARVAHALSGLSITMGHYAFADSMSRIAIDGWQRLHPGGSFALASALDMSAHLAHARSDDEQAEATYRRALEMRRTGENPRHPDIAANLNDLGVVLLRRDATEASTLLREALRLRRDHYGDEHPYVANTLGNLAVLHHEAGALREAEPLYREALAIYDRTLGSSHPRAVTMRGNLATLLQDRGDVEQARRLYLQAIEECRRLYTEPHPQLGRMLYNLATLDHAQGLTDNADVRYHEALNILAATLPTQHPDRTAVGEAYADFRRATGRPPIDVVAHRQ